MSETLGKGKQLQQWKRDLKDLKAKCKQECGKTKDKKEKKEIEARYADLEKELQVKIDAASQVDGDDDVEDDLEDGNEPSKGPGKSTRRRIAKEEREREAQRLRDVEYATNKPLSTIESELMEQQRNECGLALKDIASDGNCLFRAFTHQMQYSGMEDAPDHERLRQMCADFLVEHADDFQIFMEEPYNTDDGYREYVDRIRDCEWGGQVEITALSRIFEISVEVYQGKGEQIIHINEDFPKGPVRLSFHRHLYTCPHYNSLISKTDASDD